MLFVSLALANPGVGARFPPMEAASLSGEALVVKPGRYTVVDAIRSAEW